MFIFLSISTRKKGATFLEQQQRLLGCDGLHLMKIPGSGKSWRELPKWLRPRPSRQGTDTVVLGLRCSIWKKHWLHICNP